MTTTDQQTPHMTLVSVEDGYIVREDVDGAETLSTPGPIFQTVYLREDYDLSGAWFVAVTEHRNNPPADRPWSYQPDKTAFVVKVLQEIADYDGVDIVWCESCQDPHWEDSCESVNGGDAHACTSCYEENYRSCDDCGNVVHHEDTYYTLHDENVCNRCRENNYSYCEECEGYYHNDNSEYHQHGGCDCEPPTRALTMRNEGTTLSADERLAVFLPSGVISEEGIEQIARMIRQHYHTMPDNTEERRNERAKWWNLSYKVSTMDARWQTKEGNFTKRLSKLAHKTEGLKFPPELLTKVGNVARDNSNGAEVNVELTRDLNLPAGDFYHEDSCWWQSHADSRCALKNNGGIGMRTFESSTWGDRVSGRAWIMPLRADEDGNLSATFDAETADAYMVFNGYGDLSGYTPARIVAGMVGMIYSKIGFDCPPMYVNNGTGYLVASQETIAEHAGGLTLYVDTHSSLYYNEQTRELVAA